MQYSILYCVSWYCSSMILNKHNTVLQLPHPAQSCASQYCAGSVTCSSVLCIIVLCWKCYLQYSLVYHGTVLEVLLAVQYCVSKYCAGSVTCSTVLCIIVLCWKCYLQYSIMYRSTVLEVLLAVQYCVSRYCAGSFACSAVLCSVQHCTGNGTWRKSNIRNICLKMFIFSNILRYSTHLIFKALHASAYIGLEFCAYPALRLWCC